MEDPGDGHMRRKILVEQNPGPDNSAPEFDVTVLHDGVRLRKLAKFERCVNKTGEDSRRGIFALQARDRVPNAFHVFEGFIRNQDVLHSEEWEFRRSFAPEMTSSMRRAPSSRFRRRRPWPSAMLRSASSSFGAAASSHASLGIQSSSASASKPARTASSALAYPPLATKCSMRS